MTCPRASAAVLSVEEIKEEIKGEINEEINVGGCRDGRRVTVCGIINEINVQGLNVPQISIMKFNTMKNRSIRKISKEWLINT